MTLRKRALRVSARAQPTAGAPIARAVFLKAKAKANRKYAKALKRLAN